MDIGNNINWQRLMSAITFYNSQGYKYVDLDWTVNENISEITKPLGKRDFFVNDKALVASGEQSFLQMIVDGKLVDGKYCGITPCFRDEYEIDNLHQQYFMKVELIDTLNINHKTRVNAMNKMINSAKEFYSNYLAVQVTEVQDEMYDIEDIKNRIELGSYGTRQYKNIEWVFGTGLAEPRLSRVLKIQ